LSAPVPRRPLSAQGRVRRPLLHPSANTHAKARPYRGEPASGRPPTARGVKVQPPEPGPRSQSLSRGYGSVLPTSLTYINPLTRGCSPWRPDAVMSTTVRAQYLLLRLFKGRRGRSGHHKTCGALPAARALSPCKPISGRSSCEKEKISLPRSPRRRHRIRSRYRPLPRPRFGNFDPIPFRWAARNALLTRSYPIS
jgi:hypothetical protein